jgi:hypothetical protein
MCSVGEGMVVPTGACQISRNSRVKYDAGRPASYSSTLLWFYLCHHTCVHASITHSTEA